MREPTYFVLASLLGGPLHGYAIIKRAGELSGGRVRLATGTLYTALDRLTRAGLIDDAAFARAWVESRHYSRGLSRRSLSAELRRQGVQSEEIREAVDILDPEQEVATARRLVEQKMAGTRGQPPEARARRAAGTLARKGYPAGLAAQVVREALEQEQESDAGYRADLAWISEDGAGDDQL